MQTDFSKPQTNVALPRTAAKRDHAPFPSTLHDKHVFDDLVTWDGPNDPANPQNWSKGYKWFLTMVCSLMSISMASSAPSAASSSIATEFNASYEVSVLVTALFQCGYVVGPIFWGPGSELVGRRPIFLSTMIAFTLLHLGQSLAPNMATLLVTRFLTGFFGAAPLSNCTAVIVDIWPAVGRGAATAIITTSVFGGTAFGPVLGSFITESHLGWRGLFWIIMIYPAICTVLAAFLLPETYAPVLLQQKAKRLRETDPIANRFIYTEHETHDWSVKGVLHRTLYRPFYMLANEPILMLVTAFLSLENGILYGLFEAIPVIFTDKRNFSVFQAGLVFCGVGVGTSIGAISSIYLDGNTPDVINKWQGFPPPENRLYGALVGGPCLITGIFWLGWTGENLSVPWYIPALSTIPIGASITLVFISFSGYLLDTYLMYSASAIAASVMIRSCIGAAFPLFTLQMLTKMGINWAATLLGLIGLLLTCGLFFFFKFGSRIRSRSKFAPCLDLSVAKTYEDHNLNVGVQVLGRVVIRDAIHTKVSWIDLR